MRIHVDFETNQMCRGPFAGAVSCFCSMNARWAWRSFCCSSGRGWATPLGGFSDYAGDQMAHGGSLPTLSDYVTSSRFWFESFQNWQSEFLAIAAMVWLSVYLRQKGSPESKPVHAPHHETGR